MKQEPIADLVFDSDIYPRHDIDADNINKLILAFENDEPIPPLVVCKKTKKIIDGVHRWKALLRMYKADAKWYIKWETFASDEARFIRCAQLNARHGLRLSSYDWAHCAAVAEKLKISTADLASAIGVTKERFEGAIKERFAKATVSNVIRQPLKRSIRHMAGKTLNAKQWETNEKLSGWSAKFHADQLLKIIEAELLDKDDEESLESLKRLHGALEELLVA